MWESRKFQIWTTPDLDFAIVKFQLQTRPDFILFIAKFEIQTHLEFKFSIVKFQIQMHPDFNFSISNSDVPRFQFRTRRDFKFWNFKSGRVRLSILGLRLSCGKRCEYKTEDRFGWTNLDWAWRRWGWHYFLQVLWWKICKYT